MQARVMIFLVFALIVAVFAVINIQPVVIDFFFGQTEIQLVFVIIFSILTGALFMFILSSMKQIQLSRKIKTLEKENKKLNEEIEKLKPVLADTEVQENKEGDIKENNTAEKIEG